MTPASFALITAGIILIGVLALLVMHMPRRRIQDFSEVRVPEHFWAERRKRGDGRATDAA
jgi:hypothetical protein